MIRKDEISPSRSRRRFYDFFTPYSDATGKLTYPQGRLLLRPIIIDLPFYLDHSYVAVVIRLDHLIVGRYIRNKFGLRSGVTAVFMMHAIINGNPQVRD